MDSSSSTISQAPVSAHPCTTDPVCAVLSLDKHYRKCRVQDDIYKLVTSASVDDEHPLSDDQKILQRKPLKTNCAVLAFCDDWKNDSKVSNKPTSSAKRTKSVKPTLSDGKETLVSYRFSKFLKLFDRVDWSNILLAGGACFQSVTQVQMARSDFDFFVYGLATEQEASTRALKLLQDIVDALRNFLQKNLQEEIQVIQGPGCITICDTVGITKGISRFPVIQVILRLYSSISEILHGFDLGCCAVGYDGTNFWTTSLGLFCLEHRCNIVDPSRRSFSYEARLIKYWERGCSIVCPNLNIDKALASIKTETSELSFVFIESHKRIFQLPFLRATLDDDPRLDQMSEHQHLTKSESLKHKQRNSLKPMSSSDVPTDIAKKSKMDNVGVINDNRVTDDCVVPDECPDNVIFCRNLELNVSLPLGKEEVLIDNDYGLNIETTELVLLRKNCQALLRCVFDPIGRQWKYSPGWQLCLVWRQGLDKLQFRDLQFDWKSLEQEIYTMYDSMLKNCLIQFEKQRKPVGELVLLRYLQKVDLQEIIQRSEQPGFPEFLDRLVQETKLHIGTVLKSLSQQTYSEQLTWVTVNPGSQAKSSESGNNNNNNQNLLTSSFNPLFTDPKDWYGDLYQALC